MATDNRRTALIDTMKRRQGGRSIVGGHEDVAPAATARPASPTRHATPKHVDDPQMGLRLQNIGMQRTKTRRLNEAVELIAQMRHVDVEWQDVMLDKHLTNWIIKLHKKKQRPSDDMSTWPTKVKDKVGILESGTVRRFVDLVIEDLHRSYNNGEYDLSRTLYGSTSTGATGNVLERTLNDVERWQQMRERFKRRGLVINSVKEDVTSGFLLAGAGAVAATAVGILGYTRFRDMYRRNGLAL